MKEEAILNNPSTEYRVDAPASEASPNAKLKPQGGLQRTVVRDRQQRVRVVLARWSRPTQSTDRHLGGGGSSSQAGADKHLVQANRIAATQAVCAPQRLQCVLVE